MHKLERGNGRPRKRAGGKGKGGGGEQKNPFQFLVLKINSVSDGDMTWLRMLWAEGVGFLCVYLFEPCHAKVCRLLLLCTICGGIRGCYQNPSKYSLLRSFTWRYSHRTPKWDMLMQSGFVSVHKWGTDISKNRQRSHSKIFERWNAMICDFQTGLSFDLFDALSWESWGFLALLTVLFSLRFLLDSSLIPNSLCIWIT